MDQALHHQQQLEQQQYEECDAPLSEREYQEQSVMCARRALGAAESLKDLRDFGNNDRAVFIEKRLIQIATEFQNLKKRRSYV